MPLRRLLLVPGQRLTGAAAPWLRRLIRTWRPAHGAIIHEGELQYFGDLPALLGPENVAVLSQTMDPRLFGPPEAECPYPSCHGAKLWHTVPPRHLPQILRQVDAVLISITAGPIIQHVITAARRHDIPIALFDRPDHPELYGDPARQRNTFREFRHGDDFDLYFKQELLPDCQTDYTRPLSPLPVRLESYTLTPAKKEFSVFFCGRPRYKDSQDDKKELLEKAQQNIPRSRVLLHTARDSFLTNAAYWHNLMASQIALSPSCKVWDSYRHCEIGLSETTAIVAPIPYTVTCGPPLQDGKNAILYRTRLGNNGKYHLDDPDIIDKIRWYLDNPQECERLARVWHNDVLQGHTVTARGRYIIEQIASLR
ncbi:MAG: hypothetical protein COT71_01795 [Candidatus Andersenbacteria bacterium CG10_big_fil_rev_8_21_14_0_10_54_11]|uniref:DUF3880 domain-containing protein n=1 Tax=Candidatus Andersenbacteria bacterium CG10_big_fil_rev_8_21_14_0_10_54_11 TaxID=1974485 RepID=A0A2M6WZS6_9BACT|nr:MAG: hypothetical protein COT71_01795 [Candidatus Andersenbacteria bacterium CG10_big_fil_rev_8_21_14_0_10_54_11]